MKYPKIHTIPAIILIVLMVLPLHSCRSPRLAEQLRSEVVLDLRGNILPFWMAHAVDSIGGGFYGVIERDGTGVPQAQRGGVLNARILWTFSAAYRLYGDEAYKAMADRAQQYFIDHFIDPDYGGTFWQINPDGSPADDAKQTYGLAYAVYGLSEHYRATGSKESLEKALDIYMTLESKARDVERGGYIETFARDWGVPERVGYDGTGVATKTMNTHIHVLEAYTNLYRAFEDASLRQGLTELVCLLRDKFYDSETGHLHLYFDSEWNQVGGRIDSYGHDIETSWLLSEALETLDDKELSESCLPVVRGLADAALSEGLSDAGGMTYERGEQGTNRGYQWWCQCETVIGCVNLWQLTGDESYLKQAVRTWDFIKEHFIDRECGEWFRNVSQDLEPVLRDPKASLWNCPYHNSRLGFELDARLGKGRG